MLEPKDLVRFYYSLDCGPVEVAFGLLPRKEIVPMLMNPDADAFHAWDIEWCLKDEAQRQSLCLLHPELYMFEGSNVYANPSEISGLRKCYGEDYYGFAYDLQYGVVDYNSRDGATHGYFLGEPVYSESEIYMTEELRTQRGCFYCDSCEEWVENWHSHDNDDDCCDDDDRHTNDRGLYEYHKLERKDKSKGDGWLCGIEIEKEDGSIELDPAKLYRTMGWCLEQDGSLDEETGFEAVSPIFSLFDRETINEHLEYIKDIVNAKYTSSCGGHIHISHTGINNEKVYDMLSSYFPLLFSMYPRRISVNYSEAMPKESMKCAGKYASVALQNFTVEIRIFPSPKSVKTLQWRLDLIRIMVSVERATSIEHLVNQMFDINSTLFKHLTLVYRTPGKYVELLKKVIAMAKEFESVDLKRTNALKRLEKLLYRKFNNKKEEVKCV
jgi:hypothetical protein